MAKGILETFDALDRKEQTAWNAWFAGGRSNVIQFSDRPKDVFFGKAECEWVDFEKFWLGKVVDLDWIVVTTDGPHEIPNQTKGKTFTKFQFSLTDLGCQVHEAEKERFRSVIEALPMNARNEFEK